MATAQELDKIRKSKMSNASTNNLRQPVTVIKKKSAPLDSVIDELQQLEEAESHTNAKQHSTGTCASTGRRRFQSKDKNKKRERWLLTRKTWRYMTDAGRKLLPEGKTFHGSDSIAQIEEQFQRVCASEPRFILWRRKSSFPGATKSCSKRRLKILSQHRGHNNAAQIHQRAQELNENIDVTIELLQSYLKIRDSYKTTALLGTKTVRPDQTSSPSSQRPNYESKHLSSTDLHVNSPSYESMLLKNLKLLKNSSLSGIGFDNDNITLAILEDKASLKKIYNILKKQQLHRILHSTEPPSSKANLARSTSYSSLLNSNADNSCYGSTSKYLSNIQDSVELIQRPRPIESSNAVRRTQKPPESLALRGNSTKNLETKIVNKIPMNSCGTQTNFVQLSELKLLAEQYEHFLNDSNYNKNNNSENDEADKPPLGNHISSHRRSSIDNEDVSQSVSDTIKRYLRMARKKSLHNGDANRFKSVNYDRNLRNIKAKGEINPPGMDEGNNKAVQTLDAWAQVALDYIRGNENSINLQNAHIAWQKDLDERIRKKYEWDKQFKERNTDAQFSSLNRKSIGQSPCLSAPNSPTSPIQHLQHHLPKEKSLRTATAILSSSSHFLSNFWHANSNDPSSTQSLKYGNIRESFVNSDKNETTNMQKSKSLSNVGHFVSKKIWGSRSKGQNRQNDSHDFVAQQQKWTPLEKYSWISEEGQILQLTDTSLEKLSNIEAEVLMHIALQKIKELNIGMCIDLDRSTQKTRAISKKRALTTSFFDIGRKDEHNGRDHLFGASLECCLSRDKKQCGEVETGSKQSLTSVFRSNRVGKLNDNVRSYESLPTKSMDYGRCSPSDQVASSTSYLNNLQKFSSMSLKMSRSQFDMRNVELDLDGILFTESKNSSAMNVPMFVTICIEYLEEYGLQKVGLFRVSTSQKRVKQLREEFDKNCNMRIPDNTCPHDVATLLKEFLRDLPEPLLCKRFYTTFLETQRIRNRRLQLEAISHLIKLLPIAHRDTLYVLLKFLGNVAAHCDDICNPDGTVHIIGNKMDSNNLSTVFAPNILRDYPPKSGEYKEQGNMADAINVISTQVDILKSIENQTTLSDGTYSPVLLPDGRRQSTPILLENQNVFSASLQISKPDESAPKPTTKINQMQESTVQMANISEPKLPTSISNIGGATLCAKTAEFEKNHMTKASIPTARAKPLYKRQQLIPSSKR
ncbi:uncharacterized protein LOC6585819 isoform X2 [Drosophila mojavensis]|uniref:uncharacterized protein LOC6585819 isoform X2 n=1 Tax=Drosophila mojavensis TaxID=7230 RepID=UPI001CD0A508|nr:uncharacterized protein LOC6585819 isoform X2 [Drosophila mojavensis]